MKNANYRRKSPQYPLDRKLSGTKGRSECEGDKKHPTPALDENLIPVVQPFTLILLIRFLTC
jgi:hypothetical protein